MLLLLVVDTAANCCSYALLLLLLLLPFYYCQHAVYSVPTGSGRVMSCHVVRAQNRKPKEERIWG